MGGKRVNSHVGGVSNMFMPCLACQCRGVLPLANLTFSKAPMIFGGRVRGKSHAHITAILSVAVMRAKM